MNLQVKKISIPPLVIAAALVALVSPTVARADAVTDWNLIASNAIVVTAGQPPPVSALSFAMVQAAVYDAVNAIDRTHQPYLPEPPSNPTDSKEAAAATAAFRVLVGFPDLPGLFPAQLPTLQPQYDAYIAGLPDNPPGSRANGVAIGEATARTMLTNRQNDGRFGPSPTPYPVAPGIWRPTPPNFANDPAPWVGNVRPFLVPSAEMLRTDGPNALTSAAYTEDFNEIKEIGSLTSTTRTADQTDAAIFWQDQARRSGTGSFERWPSASNWTSLTALACLQWRIWLRLTPLSAVGTTSITGSSGGRLPRSARPTLTATRNSGRSDMATAVRPIDTSMQPAAARNAALPRPPLGARLPRPLRSRIRSRTSSAPTRSLHRLQQQILYYAELRPVLGRALRGHRRPSVGWHPFPHRRRAGS